MPKLKVLPPNEPRRFEPSEKTVAIKAAIEHACTEPGSVIAYKDVEAMIGQPVASADFQTPLRQVFQERGWQFEAVRGTGYRRLSDEEIVNKAPERRAKRARASKRDANRLTTADYDALSPDAKVTHNAELSKLGMEIEFNKPKRVKALYQEVRNHAAVLDHKKAMLALFE